LRQLYYNIKSDRVIILARLVKHVAGILNSL